MVSPFWNFSLSVGLSLTLISPSAALSQDMFSDETGLASPAAINEGRPTTSPLPELDLGRLKRLHQNAVVKIEFTAIINQEETKLNPTKSEIYGGGPEPPHGSGFFISENEILTNAHVVEQARRGSIRVKSPAAGNVEFRAEVVGVGGAETMDLAILRLPPDELNRLRKRTGLRQIPTLEFGDSDTLRQADPVAIFGYPQASDELKIIQAKVTGREYLRLGFGRFICGHQFIEVGPGGVVQPGNSGGPALDRNGRVIGIPSRGSGFGSEQGFLIPSRIVTHFLQALRENQAGRKPLPLPQLGLTLVENFAGTNVLAGAPEDTVLFELGIGVSEVTSGSLAAKWGILPGDIILGFANPHIPLSAALDFRGFRITTGRMAQWPQTLAQRIQTQIEEPAQEPQDDLDHTTEPPKLHLSEMILLSRPNDPITLWFVRPGQPQVQTLERPMELIQAQPVAHLGPFEKPEFELWGDFVAQDFNSLNVALFEIPPHEIARGGVPVTFVEPNSLASRRGMAPEPRSLFGFTFGGGNISTRWVLIDEVNNQPVRDLQQLQSALRKAEQEFERITKNPQWQPERRPFTPQRYVQIGFRTNTEQGTVVRLRPAFPVDEAMESQIDTQTRRPRRRNP